MSQAQRGRHYWHEGSGAGEGLIKVQLHTHRCVLFSFLCKNLGCSSCFLKQRASKEDRPPHHRAGREGSTDASGGAARAAAPTARGRTLGRSRGGKETRRVVGCFVRKQAGQPHIHGASRLLVGAVGSGEGLRPRRCTGVALPAAGGQAGASGLALLHLHRPRLDGACALHLRGGQGGLRQGHGSQAGLLIHAGLCLWTEERGRAVTLTQQQAAAPQPASCS